MICCAPTAVIASLMSILYQSTDRLKPGSQWGLVDRRPPSMCRRFPASESGLPPLEGDVGHLRAVGLGAIEIGVHELAARGEQIVEVGRPDVARAGAAQPQVVIDRPSSRPAFQVVTDAAGRIGRSAGPRR